MTLSNPVRVVIVEDQPAIRKDVRVLMQRPPFIVVGECGSVHDALVLIPGTHPDLLLLDITLSDGTAFDILQRLSSTNFKVIFLTAHQEHAIKAIKYSALDYLLKPLDENELSSALEKVLISHPVATEQIAIAQSQYNKTGPRNRLVLHALHYLQIVELDEIVYAKSDTGYTTFYLTDGKKIITSKYLKEYEDLLPPTLFLKTHQSYIVNINFLDRYHKGKEGQLFLKNGIEIPVSARRREAVAAYFK